MKYIFNLSSLLMAVVMLFASGCSGEPRVINDLERGELRGSVRSVTVSSLSSLSIKYKNSTKRYTKEGYLLEEIYFDAPGKSSYRYTYGDDKSTITKIEKVFSNGAVKPYMNDVSISALQRVIDDHSDDGKYKNTYNEDGYLIERKSSGTHTSGAKATFTTTYVYDQNNLVVEEIHSNSHEGLNFKYKMTYNKQGDLISKYHYDKSGKEQKNMRMEYKYAYDKQGNWIKRTTTKTYMGAMGGPKEYEREIIYY